MAMRQCLVGDRQLKWLRDCITAQLKTQSIWRIWIYTENALTRAKLETGAIVRSVNKLNSAVLSVLVNLTCENLDFSTCVSILQDSTSDFNFSALNLRADTRCRATDFKRDLDRPGLIQNLPDLSS